MRPDDAPLPANVYRLPQKEFAAIPGNPWVYWVSDSFRNLFRTMPAFGEVARPRQGVATTDNFRYLRYWWEVGKSVIAFNYKNRRQAQLSQKRWFPYVKGGPNKPWYGNLENIINWYDDGKEITATEGAVIRNPDFYFREGLTFNRFAGSRFAIRWLKPGYIFDCNGPSVFGNATDTVLAIANSTIFSRLCFLMNPTVNFQVGDVLKVPLAVDVPNNLVSEAYACVKCSFFEQSFEESELDFFIPPKWVVGINHLTSLQLRILDMETKIDECAYQLYSITPADRIAIETELAGGQIDETEDDRVEQECDEESASQTMTLAQLAVRWISYAVGIVLGRFQPGIAGVLGSAIYRRSDFAIGSLPAPDEAEFDELVGAPERFAYVDPQGGRHVFSAQVEKALQALALPDGAAEYSGIAVLDEGHPRDLARLVEQALVLMLGEQGAEEVIQTIDDRGLTNDGRSSSLVHRPSSVVLRQFLEKDFFTAWHFKWYRKRPVYWPIQSSKRAYGFVIFHEKITRETFYAIQREPYLDTKRNAVALKMADVQQALGRAAGVQRKKLEKQLDELQKLADELAAFAKDLEAITLGGYEPEENWIDDGVILRMAPLWKVVPIWKSEPKKYWERLEAGDFDWSHIAMKYWPDRVRQKCKQNKSYAIAHGHEEWYQG